MAGALVLAGGVLYGMSHQSATQSFGAFNPTGGGTYYLQSSINATQTTIALSSFTEPGSNIPYTMTYLHSSIEYATINPQGAGNPTGAKSEFVSFTGITQNTNGTALLTGVTRGLERSYPYFASSTVAYSAPGQTQFILSSPPQFFNQYYALANTASSTNTLTFSNQFPPFYYPGPGAQSTGSIISTTSEFASVAYVNAVAFSGSPNATTIAKGIVQLSTALQAASSTVLGSTAASLVVQSGNSTDTPQSGCASGYTAVAGAGCNMIADLTGHIKQAWLNLTQAFTFSTTTSYFENVGTLTATSSARLPANTTIGGLTPLTSITVPHYSFVNTGTLTANNGWATSSPVTIPAGVMTASSTWNVMVRGTCTTSSSDCQYYLRETGGTTIAECNWGSDTVSGNVVYIWMFGSNQSSLSSQSTNLTGWKSAAGSTAVDCSANFTSSFNTAGATTFVLVVRNTGAQNTVANNYSIVVNP